MIFKERSCTTTLQLEWEGTHTETRFSFPWNGWVHVTRLGWRDSCLLAGQACASVDNVCTVLDMQCLNWVSASPHFRFPFTSPHMLHRVPSHTTRAVLTVFSTVHVNSAPAAVTEFYWSWCAFNWWGESGFCYRLGWRLCYAVWQTSDGRRAFVLLAN